MRRLTLCFLMASCARAAAPTPRPVPPAVSPPAIAAPVDAPPPAAPTCAVSTTVDTVDDGEGVPSATGSKDLEDVRIVADDDKIALAWARQTHFLYGDSWREPHFALKSGAAAWRDVELPVLAFACALYGVSATNTVERPFVSWGVANNNAFEVFDDLPALRMTKGIVPDHSRPVAEITTTKQTVAHFVASRNVAFGVLHEDKCQPSCTCANDPANQALWLRSLDRLRPWAQRVSSGYTYEDKAGAPAISMGDAGGIIAYRARSKLHLAWLAADGKLLSEGRPIEIDSGDVGAPAVAMAGTEAIVVWARRATKDEPYELQSLRLAFGAAPIAPTPIKTQGSAFAPAIVADARAVTLAWMEGDGGRRGEIHVARELGGPSVVVSGDEINARDPELSGSPTHPAIVWQSFPKERMSGVMRVARLDCGP